MKEFKFPVTESQSYLIKTIIGDTAGAIENYNKWIDSVNITNFIDGESYALIPALYKKLFALGFHDVNMNKYKGIYKKAFFKNSLTINALYQIGLELNAKKIVFTVIKGVSLLINYLKDFGIRSMGDADIVVDKEDIPETIKTLNGNGFISDCSYDIYSNIETRHSYAFRNDKNLEIDLHWLPVKVSNKNTDLDSLIQIKYKKMHFNMHAPEDFIFKICLHGASWDPVVSIRWIFDLHIVLSNEKAVDWEKLLGKITPTRLSYLFYLQFRCFNEHSSLRIPEWVISSLYECGDNRICKKHAKNAIIRPKTIIGRLNWYGYSNQFKDKSFLYRLTHFLRHKLMLSRYDRYRDLFGAFITKYIFKR